MIVIPAIDIKGGRCVRLEQGRMNRETVFADSPQLMAIRWCEQGAERLHIVDLDGAVNGRPVNRSAIKSIVDAVPVPVQLGGGIRDMATLESYFDLGLNYAILGTAACKDPGFVEDACREFPGRIILGIDARAEKVALEGWVEDTLLTPRELAQRFESSRPAALVYTDINRDGMRSGPNLEATRKLARSVATPVIASGGIANLEDVKALLSLAEDGLAGMITGRAIYAGSLDFAAAVRVCREAASGRD